MEENIYKYFEQELESLDGTGNRRKLPHAVNEGKYISVNGKRMLNISSNDYLGLACDQRLQNEFLNTVGENDKLLSASSSRLLTGNFGIYDELENRLAELFGTESALVFNSGYHMNMGILPAVSDSSTLILADKLVHASIIDGIRLCNAKCIRFRHQDYGQLEKLIEKNKNDFNRIIVVTESIFSMDGDTANLPLLADIKKRYPGVMLYVDEAHAVGVRGKNGLGLAEETGCIKDIDFLCGTFGKALCSVGAYIVCKKSIREYLVNRMRTLIFTTALPPLNIAWTKFVLDHLPDLSERRTNLALSSNMLRRIFKDKGYGCISESHILPLIIGKSEDAILKAEDMQKKGVYVLPIRPPTVPEGTSRLRFSLTASIGKNDLELIIKSL